jgi:hypothetical protein
MPSFPKKGLTPLPIARKTTISKGNEMSASGTITVFSSTT